MGALAATLALFAVLGSHPVAHSVASEMSAPAFCESAGPRDYAAPLASLPPVNKVPAESKRVGWGNLPFGPTTTEMYVDTEGPVMVNPEHFGYAFWDVGFERNRPERHPKLAWHVTAQMMALDPTGAVSEEVDRGSINISRIDDAYQPSLNLNVPKRVGFYRYDIQISSLSGSLLGSYIEYLRVVPHSLKVRLGINGRRFRPGQMVATRPEELGTDQITFGESFAVQRRIDGSWRHYRPMTHEAWAAWLGYTSLGGAGRCSTFRIPADTPSGRYRVVKGVSATPVGGRKSTRGLRLSAPFSVVGSG